MIGSAVSQLGNVVTAFDLNDTGANESISARMHRQGHGFREWLINSILFDDQHCENAHQTDIDDAMSLLDEVAKGKGFDR